MRKTAIWLGVIVLALPLVSVGCRREAASNAAIQRAIEEHLSQRSDLERAKMVMEMKQVKVEGDRAEAEVTFRTTSDPQAQMTFHYQLHKEGGKWAVETGKPSAADSPHPGSANPSDGGMDLPEGHPPVDNPPPHP